LLKLSISKVFGEFEMASEKKVKYHLNANAQFLIDNYNFAKPLANFFPGIAGKYGIPMWVFYVNRGQAISCFGTDGKDGAILEFQPANKAWQQTSLLGFRTFIKLSEGKKELFYEPFHNGFVNQAFDITNQMSMSSYDLKLKEENSTLGINVKVEYFTIPQDSYAALVRTVTIKNTFKKTKKIQLLDGLPRIVPFGIANYFLKKLSRTIEAWMRVENLDHGIPFYKVDVDPLDRPRVIHIKGGNFFLSFLYEGKKAKITKPIVDPEPIFGQISDFSCPRQFLAQKFKYPIKQQTQCKTPCGFAFLNFTLAAAEEKTFYSIYGNARSLELLNSSLKRIIAPGYLAAKNEENKRIIEELQEDVNTQSSSWEFDQYSKQTYLDNIIRGGYPSIFQSDHHQTVFYLYSRKHGDLERDYNKFQIQPTYFSQGNGNFRDMNQNRRCDIWFNPQIKDYDVIAFFDLLQADGFNPLVVKGVDFSLKEVDEFKAKIKGKLNETAFNKILTLLEKPFTPGEVILFLEENNIKLDIAKDEFLNILLSLSIKNPQASHGEGFWTDHWSYNLDLLESYLEIYPEKLKEIIFDKKEFIFYDNDAVVRPRSEKYILLDGKPRQLHAVARDPGKTDMIAKRTVQPHAVRTNYGQGEIYRTTLINKLFCVFVNKLASFDPQGLGIEMEADKPNWFDALNGLPALFGSSSCETFELKRLALFIKDALLVSNVERISLTEEVHNFLFSLSALLNENLNSSSADKDYQYWDKSYGLKEDYRQKTKFGFSGKETETSIKDILSVLENGLKKIEKGLEKARDSEKNIYYAYFINEVTGYSRLNDINIKPLKFVQKKLPFFLEGQMHALRLTNDLDQARKLYQATKLSSLYDKKLKMYKVTSPLKNMPEEIGRCRAFTPGWLENESIWLHMEYKYLLEILEQGLYEEFYADFKNVLIPFQKPERYGRSILENSSFLVSSAFPYKELHGNGFVARLSGSTAEFIHLWLLMNLGKKPFVLNDKKELNLKFAPKLAGWLFTKKEKTYSFRLLGKTLVVYHNPKRKNTFGKSAVVPRKIVFNDRNEKCIEILSDTITSPYAEQLRSQQIKRIDIFLE
jgi:hypothetical protein